MRVLAEGTSTKPVLVEKSVPDTSESGRCAVAQPAMGVITERSGIGESVTGEAGLEGGLGLPECLLHASEEQQMGV